MGAMRRFFRAMACEFGRDLHLSLFQSLDLESDRVVQPYRPAISRRSAPCRFLKPFFSASIARPQLRRSYRFEHSDSLGDIH